MTDLNTVTVAGRLTRDTDEKTLGYLPTGIAKAAISLAVNKSIKKGDSWQDEPSYFDVVIFGKTAENITPKLSKGCKLLVSGSLKQERWETSAGEKKNRVVIIADHVEIMSGKKEETGNGAALQTRAAPAAAPQPMAFSEDIPF